VTSKTPNHEEESMEGTELCDLLQIRYPIIQAPMAWVATAELAAAVSEAGGLGTIGPNAGMESQREAGDIQKASDRMREQIRKARTLTEKPFAVNLPVGWGKQRILSDRLVEVAIEEGIEIAVVSMGSSKAYTAKLNQKGIKVLHAVGTVEHARKAEQDGVDGLICEGVEGGGHLGGEELTTFVLVPQVADAVRIPVIAGGGIADARGVVAAFALGAKGVYLGTRFLACRECSAHPNAKKAVLDASDTSTVVFARRTGVSRCLKNRYTAGHLEMENQGADFEKLREYERFSPALGEWRRLPGAVVAGNIEFGALAMGAAAGIIHEILPAAEIIRQIVDGYDCMVRTIQADQGYS
jgi:enoyl-[acyl-carrier protein] reductase II